MNSPLQRSKRRSQKLSFQINPPAPLKGGFPYFHFSSPPLGGLGGELFKNQNNLLGEADTH
jgi:hypothetical protein